MTRVLVVLVVVLCLASCTASSTQELNVPAWLLSPDVRIGSYDDSLTAFSDVTAILPLDDGTVLIADAYPPFVRHFDVGGEPLKRFGSRGNGPGEYTLVGHMGLLNDSLYIIDPALGRVTLLDSSRAAKTFHSRLPAGEDYSWIYPTALMTDGNALAIPNAAPVNVDSLRALNTPVVRLNRQNDVIDTLLVVSRLHGLKRIRRFIGETWRSTYVRTPWADDPIVVPTWNADAVLVIDRRSAANESSAAVAITKINLQGDTILQRSLRYRPIPLLQSVVDSVIADRGEPLVSDGYASSSGQARQIIGRAIQPPKYLPPVTAAIAGKDGTLWLRRESDNSGTYRWTILDETLRPIGEVRVPTASQVLAATRSELWTVARDSLDVPFVTRERVITESGASKD